MSTSMDSSAVCSRDGQSEMGSAKIPAEVVFGIKYAREAGTAWGLILIPSRGLIR